MENGHELTPKPQPTNPAPNFLELDPKKYDKFKKIQTAAVVILLIAIIFLIADVAMNIKAVEAFGDPCAYAQYVCKTCIPIAGAVPT